jgi:hypothetical protein
MDHAQNLGKKLVVSMKNLGIYLRFLLGMYEYFDDVFLSLDPLYLQTSKLS